jgi:hypothetical protein
VLREDASRAMASAARVSGRTLSFAFAGLRASNRGEDNEGAP